MPLGKPLTFDDEISASGKLVLRHIGLRGVGYVGFFNSRRHTWRSLVLDGLPRLGGG